MIRPAIVAAALLALAGPASATRAGDPEGALAKLLGNRVAGSPRTCIFPDRAVQPEIFDGTAIVYRGARATYVNRLHGTCHQLAHSRRIVTVGTSGQLCANDPVYVSEQSGPSLGFCTLGEFVPYNPPGR